MAQKGCFTELYRRSRLKLQDGRASPPLERPFNLGCNQYQVYAPGTVYFVPVHDFSYIYINGVLEFLNEHMQTFMVDERANFRPAGVGRFAKSKGGHLDDNPKSQRTLTIERLESILQMVLTIETGMMLQNLSLMAHGMGLGGFPNWAGHEFAWFEALGFRMQTMKGLEYLGAPRMVRFLGGILGKDHAISFPIALERDGEVLLKPYCPPYYPSMEAAVHAVVERKFGSAGVLRDGTKNSSFKKTGCDRVGGPGVSTGDHRRYSRVLHLSLREIRPRPGLLGSVSDEHRIPGSSPRPGLLRASLPARGLERQAAGTHAQLAPRSPHCARTMSSRGHAAKVTIVRRLIDVGTVGVEAAEARRIRSVNVISMIGVVINVGYGFFYLTFDEPALAPLLFSSAVFVAIYGFVIGLSQAVSTTWTASLLTAVACANVMVPAAFLGAETGYQLYLIPIAGLTVWMTRGAQWPVPLGIAILSVGTFVYISMILDEALIAPFSDALLDGIFLTSATGAVALALLPPLLYRQLIVRTEADLRTARERAERLLFTILPQAIAGRIETTGDASEQIIADRYECVTVLFADIIGFTEQTATIEPEIVVARLNRVFSDFDARAQDYGLEKIKTIGDAYMLVGGAPELQADHADRVVGMALDIVSDAQALAVEVWPGLQLRVGIHSGPAVAGVIGRAKFSYDLWGDTVNELLSKVGDGGFRRRVRSAFLRP